ncbi:MAG: radical SAM protein [Candidatus Latescibacteria bacterium]|jgi:wyosine [tRNA(Phe)-imidazoG37] synthetase (radical SAM superfamily)|nr:radical SAM protein [Candidatus Latescibacterota bacterium]
MKYIFGPVPSRRLGLSLGVDIVPLKTCTLSCIYCQVGKTPNPTLTRREYIPVKEVLDELESHFKSGVKTDWVTFSGSGEPTLNSGIGDILRGIKAMTDIPVCVITNGTLLWDPQVRHDICQADAVMPSLDSALESSFHKLCRPHPDSKIDMIIDGIVQFRKEYQGKLWLEIMIVGGINDTPEELHALRNAVRKIEPDTVQINTVARPPAEVSAKPVPLKRLEEIREYFGENTEIIASFKSDSKKSSPADIDDVRAYLKRRPGKVEDISSALGIETQETEKIIKQLEDSDEITLKEYFGKHFWEYKSQE